MVSSSSTPYSRWGNVCARKIVCWGEWMSLGVGLNKHESGACLHEASHDGCNQGWKHVHFWVGEGAGLPTRQVGTKGKQKESSHLD